MHRRFLLLATAGTWAASALVPAAAQNAADLAGVRYPASVQVGSTPLLLNGAGIRFRVVVRVYTAGLYLTAQFGQKLGAQQMFKIHQAYEAAIGRVVEIH